MSTERIEIVCGWCGSVLSEGSKPESTGICHACRAKHFDGTAQPRHDGPTLDYYVLPDGLQIPDLHADHVLEAAGVLLTYAPPAGSAPIAWMDAVARAVATVDALRQRKRAEIYGERAGVRG